MKKKKESMSNSPVSKHTISQFPENHCLVREKVSETSSLITNKSSLNMYITNLVVPQIPKASSIQSKKVEKQK